MSEHRDSLYRELGELLGERFSTAPSIVNLHGRDESPFPPQPPDAVAFPETTDEVTRVVRVCARASFPIIPFGAGTSVEGHVLAPRGGLSLDMTRMDAVLAVHADDLDATVEAGVTRKRLNARLADKGLFFAVDPGADATLGGMAATRASGTNAVRYGTMRENVLGLTVVLADGTAIRTGGRARKSSAGYDLTRLFVGSEGTLGVITEVTVKLCGRPEAISAAVCAFPDIESAVATAIEVVQWGIPVARMELLDEAMMDAIRRYSGLEHAAAPTLFFEFHGSESAVAEQAEETQGIAADHGGHDFAWAIRQEDRERLWRARHEAYFASLALRPGSRALSTDVCVPISELAGCVAAAKAEISRVSIPVTLVGHAGDGNFHLIILIDPDREEDLAQAERLNATVVEHALSHGGTSTGEHGVGLGKRKWMEAEHGPALEVMRSLKRALDPEGIFNPGKIFPATGGDT